MLQTKLSKSHITTEGEKKTIISVQENGEKQNDSPPMQCMEPKWNILSLEQKNPNNVNMCMAIFELQDSEISKQMVNICIYSFNKS